MNRSSALTTLVSLVFACTCGPVLVAYGENAPTRVVAAIDFVNLNPTDRDNAWIGVSVAEILHLGLEKVPGLRTIGPNVIREYLAQERVRGGRETAIAPIQVGKALGADRVVTGSYDVKNGAVTLQVTVIDVPSGEVVTKDTIEGKRGETFGAFVRATQAVVASFDKKIVAREARPQVVEAPPEERIVLSEDVLGWLRNRRTSSEEAWESVCKGVYEFLLGQPDEAIRLCTRAIELDPQYYLAYAHRAQALQFKNRDDDAIKDLTRAIELKPDSPAIYRERAMCYGRKKDFDAALRDLDRALEIRPDDVQTLYTRSLTNVGKGDYDAALKDANRAIELRPTYAFVYYYRAIAYEKLGKAKEALADCNMALQLPPYFVPAYYTRAKVYAQMKDYDKAWADLKAFTRTGRKPEPEFLEKLKKESGRTE